MRFGKNPAICRINSALENTRTTTDAELVSAHCPSVISRVLGRHKIAQDNQNRPNATAKIKNVTAIRASRFRALAFKNRLERLLGAGGTTCFEFDPLDDA